MKRVSIFSIGPFLEELSKTNFQKNHLKVDAGVIDHREHYTFSISECIVNKNVFEFESIIEKYHMSIGIF